MVSKKIQRRLHFAGTLWLLLSAGLLLVISLRQAGVQWWVIFSLSGYSAVLVLFFVSIYLFAIFRGLIQRQNIDVEHPLTSTEYYMMFYNNCPFLGALAGFIDIVGLQTNVVDKLTYVATGSLVTTFLVWIIIDPLTGIVEMLLPSSRKARHVRLSQEKQAKIKIEQANEALLEEVASRAQAQLQQWQREFEPAVENLCQIVRSYRSGESSKQLEGQAVELGALLWQKGGLEGMKFVHQRVTDQVGSPAKADNSDPIDLWWDGIGSWRGKFILTPATKKAGN